MAGLLVAASASAQKEQWLQYRTDRDGRGFRHLDLTTNTPANLTLPKFHTQPYFAKWSTPMDPQGRWVVFDSTRKAGPYDLVYVDTKGDGKLDGQTPAKAVRIDPYYAYFDPVRVVFKGEDGPITYHLNFQFMKYQSGNSQYQNLYVRSGGYYEGQVDLGGGKKKHIELSDENVNGTFNDLAAEPGGCDHVIVQGEKAPDRFLGKMVEVENEFYRIEVAKDGAFVKLDKATDLKFGTVRIPEAVSQFVAFGENGHFMRQPVKGEFKLPVGEYLIHEWNITRKDSKGASWEMSGSDFPGGFRFAVAEGKPVNLDIGEPVRAVVNHNDNGAQISFDLNFKGRMNESITIRRSGQNPPGPKLTLATLDGSYRITNTFEFG